MSSTNTEWVHVGVFGFVSFATAGSLNGLWVPQNWMPIQHLRIHFLPFEQIAVHVSDTFSILGLSVQWNAQNSFVALREHCLPFLQMKLHMFVAI
jgi:hypothetical protein